MQPFEQVVTDHSAMVLRVCRAVLGPQDAEDAWSETFLSALKAYPDLPPDANIEAWLVTIAHRKSIDVIRVAARGPTPVEALPERPSHNLAGLPYKEIAALCGGSTDAARRAAADGIKTLRTTYPRPTDQRGVGR
jgi:DNA-directed RNA polymerase specialized sigma24 family protein